MLYFLARSCRRTFRLFSENDEVEASDTYLDTCFPFSNDKKLSLRSLLTYLKTFFFNKTTGDTINGDAEITGTLDVDGKTTVNSGLDVVGDTSITGDETVSGNVTVNGDANFNSDVTIGTEENPVDLTINGNIYQNGSAYETHAQDIYTENDMIITRDGATTALSDNELTGLTAQHYDSDGYDGVLAFDNSGTARVGDYNNKTVYSTDGKTFYKTKNTVYVYSTDGETFYADGGLTELATIPSYATVTQDESWTEETPAYYYYDYSDEITIPSGITPTATENDYEYLYFLDDTQPLATRDEDSDMDSNGICIWDATNRKVVTVEPASSLNRVPVSNSDGTFTWKQYSNGSVWTGSTTSDWKTARLIEEGTEGFIADGSLVVIFNEGKVYVQSGTGADATLSIVATNVPTESVSLTANRVVMTNEDGELSTDGTVAMWIED